MEIEHENEKKKRWRSLLCFYIRYELAHTHGFSFSQNHFVLRASRSVFFLSRVLFVFIHFNEFYTSYLRLVLKFTLQKNNEMRKKKQEKRCCEREAEQKTEKRNVL